MSSQYFVVRAEESQRCPVAVVRVSPDGTEEAFTRSLAWGPSDLLARHGGEPTVFEISADDVEQLVVDLVVDVRAERYEVPYGQGTNIYAWFAHRSDVFDLDKACVLVRDFGNGTRERFLPTGTWSAVWSDANVPESDYFKRSLWGNPRSPVRVPISAAESDRLVAQGLAWPPTSFVVPGDERRLRRMAREHVDGGLEVFTDDLCWEPFEWDGEREYAGRYSMIAYLETVERGRPVTSGGDHDYSVLFEDFEQADDLLLARNLVRLPDGDPERAQEWQPFEGWRDNFRVRDRNDERTWFDAELRITKAQADEYVRLRTEWSTLRVRVWGRLGN
ncbi:hypothetical protein [Lentzea albida]|uniref:Uncharacterized protein n=1 Tax=Lentzea albida TaxID=65499 RepID=A0A1H9F4Q6_9PSEU|nr:hypothetical protein [Lentzea albida]SEQ32867.1 hypothetical protein SAMN04488000_102533 [Lentzea albida]